MGENRSISTLILLGCETWLTRPLQEKVIRDSILKDGTSVQIIQERSGLCFQLGLKSLCFYRNENLISGVLNPAVLGGDDAGPERGSTEVSASFEVLSFDAVQLA
ncbi:unnamed protein product [Arctogadus glacialis]